MSGLTVCRGGSGRLARAWEPAGEFEGDAVIVTRVTDAGEPGFDLQVERSLAAEALRHAS